MRATAGLVSICILLNATGCAYLPQRYQLAAAPLIEVKEIVPDTKVIVVQPAPSDPAGSLPKSYTVPLTDLDRVSLLVQDSQTKCAQFVNTMFAETAGTGFVLDILSTATSALATVFTPLATVHALTASSTIFGAAKTGISANYLNTLTISHITQAIQSGYTTNMQKYISSLDTADPNKISVYQERSKIVSYHNQCSLAAAEGSISNALQIAPQLVQEVSLAYKVVGTAAAGDNTAAGLAQAIAAGINGNTAFTKAGITALPPSGASISLKMTNPVKLTVTSSPTDLAQYVEATGLLTIIRKPNTGDTITIVGSAATQQPSGGAQQSGGAQTAPAAVIP